MSVVQIALRLSLSLKLPISLDAQYRSQSVRTFTHDAPAVVFISASGNSFLLFALRHTPLHLVAKMQQDFAELTIAAVDGLFGQLTSRVFACLAYRGRCKLPDVVKETRLTTRQVGTTLVVLVQHHLVYHHTDHLGQTHYEANGDSAYNIVFRTAKLAQYVGHCHGSDAAQVITKVALLGHTTAPELQREFGLNHNHVHPAKSSKPALESSRFLSNAHRSGTSSAIKSVDHLHKLLDSLLLHGYLCLRTGRQSMGESDLQVEAELYTRQKFYPQGVKGGKEKLEFEETVTDQKRKWRDEADSYSQAFEGASKRRKVSPQMPNGMNSYSASSDHAVGSAQFRLPDKIVVQLNYEKCSLIIRNQQLVNMAHRYLGYTPSKVFETVLRLLEPSISRCYDPLDSRKLLESESEYYIPPSALPSSRSILDALPKDVDLGGSLSNGATVNGVNGHSSSRPIPVSDDSSDSDPEISIKPKARDSSDIIRLEQHLRLLQSDPRQFIESQDGSWAVSFKRLTRLLIQHEIENTVLALHGQWAARIIHILHKVHSTEEKTLVNAAILKPKDVRSVTNTLIAAGLINTQEIPRDTNRTTNRLIWLYAYSPERARSQILRDSYRTMTRFLCRLAVERSARAPTIDKSERTDVIGNEDKYLTEKDQSVLEEWNRMEERVWCQVARTDEVVACMKDFALL